MPPMTSREARSLAQRRHQDAVVAAQQAPPPTPLAEEVHHPDQDHEGDAEQNGGGAVGHGANVDHGRAVAPPRQERTRVSVVPSATTIRTIYTPAAALMAARELQQYPPPEAELGPWLGRIAYLLGIAGQKRLGSQTPSRQHRERSRVPEHTPPPQHPQDREPRPARGRPVGAACQSVASSPREDKERRSQAHHPAEDARVAIERRRERQDRFVQEMAEAGRPASGPRLCR